MDIATMKAQKANLLNAAADFREQARACDRQAEELQTSIEKATFADKTYAEYIEALEGTTQEIDGLTVKISGYKARVNVKLSSGIELSYSTPIYAHSTHANYGIYYPPSDHYRSGIVKSLIPCEIPAKHKDLFARMETAADKCKVARP